jgi:hypothetical protein
MPCSLHSFLFDHQQTLGNSDSQRLPCWHRRIKQEDGKKSSFGRSKKRKSKITRKYGYTNKRLGNIFLCDTPCILVHNCNNFPTHAQFFTSLLLISAYMFRPLRAIIRASQITKSYRLKCASMYKILEFYKKWMVKNFKMFKIFFFSLLN